MSAFEVMRHASLGVFGAVALACASAPGGAFALTRAVGGIHVDVVPSAALRVIFWTSTQPPTFAQEERA